MLNRLNQRVYGHSQRRGKRRIKVVPVYEGSRLGSIKHHFHLLIDCPEGYSVDEFVALVREMGKRTFLGGAAYLSDGMVDQGWVRYILKEYSKHDPLGERLHNLDQRQTEFLGLSIDFTNAWLSAPGNPASLSLPPRRAA
jgi:hypothetical protein